MERAEELDVVDLAVRLEVLQDGQIADQLLIGVRPHHGHGQEPGHGGHQQTAAGDGPLPEPSPGGFAAGLLNVVGSLQNIESAEAGGDSYSTAASLTANGVGSILASLFGCCFPTTIYIGHPGWKAMGARSGYSLINGVFIGFLCFTGTVSWVIRAIPLEAVIGILLWIGIVICALAFQVTPR